MPLLQVRHHPGEQRGGAVTRLVRRRVTASADIHLQPEARPLSRASLEALETLAPSLHDHPRPMRELHDDAWTQVHAALRPRGRVHCKAPRI
eukprot:7386900-Prymnesium_polylepis.1